MEESFKKRKIKRNSDQNIEFHQIFLDKLAQKKEEEIGISEQKLEVPLLRRMLKGFLIFVIFIISILFIRTFQLQILQNENFSGLAQENKFMISSAQATRGVIYDKNLKQLVFNQLSFDLVCNKNNLPKDLILKEEILKEVSSIIEKDMKEIESQIEESNKPIITILENIDHEEMIALKTRIMSEQLTGFELEEKEIRDYKDGSLFAHIIGYKRKTDEKIGLEKTYDQELSEEPGELLIEKDAFGNIISKKIISEPEDGKSLILWLDSDLQEKIVIELEKTLERVGAKSGIVVALNPNNGAVLGLVSLPSFDNNLFAKNISSEQWQSFYNDPLHPLFNRVISGQYATGSSIKPLIASAALEEETISPLKRIYCEGEIKIENKYWPEFEPHYYRFRDWETHYSTDMRKAIAESCNVYFYTIGGGYENQEGLGPSKIKDYLNLFGWGEKTQIDLPEESMGLIPNPEWKMEVKEENWWDGDTYHLSIGQGDVLATPLQVASSFSVIANNGKLFKPMIVDRVINQNKEVSKKIEPEIIRENFIKQENLEIIRQGMRQAVTSNSGSSFLLNNLPVEVAAKTGTAEIPIQNHYHNWVTVFAPYENPEIVLTVMIEEVKGMQAAALPVAKGILDWYFTKE